MMTNYALIAELKDLNAITEYTDDWLSDLVGRAADALEAATRVPVQGEPNNDREHLARLLAAQGGEEWDRLVGTAEYARNRYLRKAGAILDRMPQLSRAAVPDAATERERAELWRSLDWMLWGVGMNDVFREPLADKMIAALSDAEFDQAQDLIRGWDARCGGPHERNLFVEIMAERDAATAAVERVRAIAETWRYGMPEYTSSTYQEGQKDQQRKLVRELLAALDGAPEQYEHESVAPQPSESDVRERLVEAALETVDWDAIDAGEASPREAAGHAVWKALAALDGAPEPEWEYSVGHRNSDGTYSAEGEYDDDEITDDIDEARSWVDEALDSGAYSNAILMKRAPIPGWLPVEGESE